MLFNTVELTDLRKAVQNYMNTQVTTVVSEPQPDADAGAGAVINPGDQFKFNVTATNAANPDGVRLINVRWSLSVDATSKLIVPSGFTATSVLFTTIPSLIPQLQVVPVAPGDQVSNMLLTPLPILLAPSDRSVLDVGESDSINDLKGIAGSAGVDNIRFRVIADPDLDFLLPKNEDSPLASEDFTVVAV